MSVPDVEDVETGAHSPGEGLARIVAAFLLPGLLLLGAGSIPRAAHAQAPETVVDGPCALCQPRALAVADFDGGAKDVVVGERVNNRVRRSLAFYSGTGTGTGSGRLGPKTAVGPAVRGPRALAAGELTGDTNRDLVVADASADTVMLLPGNGDGTFGDREVLGTPSGPVDVVVSDFDGANGPDVAVAAERGGAIKIYFNDGSGGVSSTRTIYSSSGFSRSSPVSLAAADLEGDDDVDLVAALQSGFGGSTVRVFKNTGDGSFTETTVIGLDRPQHVAFAQANAGADANLDVVAYSANTDGSAANLVWFAGNGDGTVGTSGNAVTTTSSAFFDLLVADYTGDDTADLVTVGPDAALYPGTSGGFGTAQNIAGVGQGNEPTEGAASAVDLDGDGALDVVSVSGPDDQASFRKGDDAGGFTAETLVASPDVQSPAIIGRPQVGDVDGNGAPDIVVTGLRTGVTPREEDVIWYPNTGKGQFGDAQVVTSGGGERIGAVAVEDVDDDGRADIFVGTGPATTLTRYEKEDGGGFATTEVSSRGVGTMAIAEFNGDGQYDVVIGRGSEIAVGINQGGGAFSFTTINSDAGFLYNVAVGDVSGDGVPDIVYAGSASSGDQIAYHAGNGDGTFDGTAEQAATLSNIDNVRVRDLDGQGPADLVAVRINSGPTVFRATGGGTFGAGTSYSGTGAPVAVADVNGDGAPDLLQGTTWRANEGTGAYGSRKTYATTVDVRAVAAGRIDADADLDPVVTTGTDKTAWLENDRGVLPVELTRFTARQDGASAVQLRWQTVSETNNAGFRVERNAEGESWSQVGYVESKAPGGTSTEALRYRYRDADVPFAADTLRYRLTQVDTDGSTSQSEVVEVALGAVDQLTLQAPYPNPTRGAVTVKLAIPQAKSGGAQLRLYNAVGQQVRTVPVGEGGRQRVEVPTRGLASGVYFLRLTAGEATKTRRVTVVR
jgi:hypothetical protein